MGADSWIRFILKRMLIDLYYMFYLSADISFRAKAIWDFEGIFCSSRHIPHVRFAGLIHPGILGCAPSAEVLAEWNRREGELIAANTIADRIVAQPPEPKNTHAGSSTEDVKSRVAKEGARTIPACTISSKSTKAMILTSSIS